MVRAYIFINTFAGKGETLLEQIRTWDNVETAELVTGPFDLIVLINAENLDRLKNLVVGKLQKIEGVEKTLTSVVLS